MFIKGACIQIITILLVLASRNCQAQLLKKVQGVVLESGTSTILKNATVFNKATNATTITDSLGRFTIALSGSDTILISKVNYQDKALVLPATSDIRVFLSRANELAEVIIKGQSVRSEMKDLTNTYKAKGIFFKGKPPIYLLSPFGGSPVTFFYELLSKDGKRARRLQKFAQKGIEYSELSRRFNDNTIKSVLPGISETELEKFKTAYLATMEQIAEWSDYDLLAYIKRSYGQFVKTKTP